MRESVEVKNAKVQSLFAFKPGLSHPIPVEPVVDDVKKHLVDWNLSNEYTFRAINEALILPAVQQCGFDVISAIGLDADLLMKVRKMNTFVGCLRRMPTVFPTEAKDIVVAGDFELPTMASEVILRCA